MRSIVRLSRANDWSCRYYSKAAHHLNEQFIPSSGPICQTNVNLLQEFVDLGQRLFVITGAGLSTESGIPDYRSKNVGLYARSTRRPMDDSEFNKHATARQRYWARNFVGWSQFSAHEPNISHKILADWEQKNRIQWLVTQNVDQLHTKAGSRRVTEVHGSTYRVKCMQCKNIQPRWILQKEFLKLNPQFDAYSDMIAPDGDVHIPDEEVLSFQVPDCGLCGGILKPDVVFMGGSVDRNLVEFIFQQVEVSDRIIVLGSSLKLLSGFRFIVHAANLKKPIAIVNIDETRADKLASIKISNRCTDILSRIVMN